MRGECIDLAATILGTVPEITGFSLFPSVVTGIESTEIGSMQCHSRASGAVAIGSILDGVVSAHELGVESRTERVPHELAPSGGRLVVRDFPCP